MAMYVLVVVSICLLWCSGVQAISIQSDPTILNDQPHPISVLATSEDDDFDCVDIYKQPALSHPLLKNHKIQLYPRFSKEQGNGKVNVEVNDQQGKGCPSGKVPIQRSKSHPQFSKDFPGQHVHFATVDTVKNTTYRGAAGAISVNEPVVQSEQYSMAHIWVQSGPIAELNSIQAGWAVHPQLYGDYRARMTVQWTADGFKNTGCYNAQCPGYVQVHPLYHPGQRFRYVAIPGRQKAVWDVRIIQEQLSGNWWLICPNDTNETRLGYWPKELFTHLANGASVVRYGGTTSTSPAAPQSPPMGSGKLPSTDDPTRIGFFEQVKIVGSDYKMIDIVRSEIRGNVDAPATCYDLHFYEFLGSRGYVFGYGGPGGHSCGT